LGSQLGTHGIIIDDAAVEKFGQMLCEQITAGSSDMLRAYVRMLVGH